MERARVSRGSKERAILTAARTVFLDDGFSGAGVDAITEAAAISKATLYKYFRSKEQLFTAVLLDEIERAEEVSDPYLEALRSSSDLRADLEAFAAEFVTTVTDPDILRMRRLVIAEAERFPELARRWDERARERGLTTLRTLFLELSRQGRLSGDVDVAAEQFLWLLLGAPLNEALFHPGVRPRPQQVRRRASAAVATFLSAFGTHG